MTTRKKCLCSCISGLALNAMSVPHMPFHVCRQGESMALSPSFSLTISVCGCMCAHAQHIHNFFLLPLFHSPMCAQVFVLLVPLTFLGLAGRHKHRFSPANYRFLWLLCHMTPSYTPRQLRHWLLDTTMPLGVALWTVAVPLCLTRGWPGSGPLLHLQQLTAARRRCAAALHAALGIDLSTAF